MSKEEMVVLISLGISLIMFAIVVLIVHLNDKDYKKRMGKPRYEDKKK